MGDWDSDWDNWVYIVARSQSQEDGKGRGVDKGGCRSAIEQMKTPSLPHWLYQVLSILLL